MNAFLTRPLEGAGPYLWLDAMDLKVRAGGRIISKALICTVAVNEAIKREGLGEVISPSQTETFWADCLRSVADRGLRGVKRFLADAHRGRRVAQINVP